MAEQIVEELLSKYEESFISSLDVENIKKIIAFLLDENCSFIEELIENCLVLFSVEYPNFVERYNGLKERYGENLIDMISSNLSLLEEIYLPEM